MEWIAIATLAGLGLLFVFRNESCFENIEKALENAVTEFRLDLHQEHVARINENFEAGYARKIADLQTRLRELSAAVESLEKTPGQKTREASQAAVRALLGGE